MDVRSLYPLDTDAILRSVRKTHRAVVLYEAVRFGGFGAEIASQIQELAFDDLDAPVLRVGAAHAPVPFSEPLEQASFPDAEKVAAAIRESLQGVR